MARQTIKSAIPSKNAATKPTALRSAAPTDTPTTSPRTVSSRFDSRSLWLRIKRIGKSHLLHVLVLATLAVIGCLFFYHQGQRSSSDTGFKNAGNLQTTAAVVDRVSRHILLPSGEQPTVATVTDASKVRNQAFFSSSASGDKVLIYAQAKKAYLYRPSIDRVIEVAPLAPNTTDQSSGQ